MHIRWLGHGRGSGRRASDYLLGERDAQGRRRELVRVVVGDPELVGRVADSVGRRWRYSSGVVAFAPEDRPTVGQIDAVVGDLGRVIGAGMGSDAVAWSVVQHGRAESGSVHLHVLVARTDLVSGRAFNPAPPGWQADYDPVRDLHNVVNGWGRPDDLSRARTAPPGGVVAAMRAAAGDQVRRAEVDGVRADLTRWAVDHARAGRATNREQLLDALRAGGWQIAREAKASISVEVGGQRIRLTGGVWARDWATTTLNPDPAETRNHIQQLQAELNTRITRRAGFERARSTQTRASAARRRPPAPQDTPPVLDQSTTTVQAAHSVVGAPQRPAPGPTTERTDPDGHRDRTQAARGLERAERAGRNLDYETDHLDHATRRADRASRGLDQRRGSLNRAREHFAATARRIWIRLTGRWHDYPPDQPAQRFATPATTPGTIRAPAQTADPLALDHDWNNGPTHGGGGLSR